MRQPPDRRRSGPPRGRAAADTDIITAAPMPPSPEWPVLNVDDLHRFGQPSNYSLAAHELAAHIRQLRRSGWQSWEIRTRFDYREAA